MSTTAEAKFEYLSCHLTNDLPLVLENVRMCQQTRDYVQT